MEGLNLVPILIPLAALLIGWALGFFDSNLRASKKIKEAEASSEAAIREAKERTAQAEARMASSSATPSVSDDPGLLRIKNENGALTLDLDGARVNTSSLSAGQRKRLVEMLSLMRPWLEGQPAPTFSEPTIESRLDAISASPPSQPTPASTPSASSTPQSPSASATPSPVIAKEDRPSLPANSMIGQIDAILQARLARTPLEERGIFLAQAPDGGVNVYIGLTRYPGIDEGPDAEIKAAIRAAIAEWEKKYTPGLNK